MYLLLNFKDINTIDLISYLENDENISSLTEPNQKNKKEHGFYTFPEQTTFGFRQILRRVFCNGFYWKSPDINIVIDSVEFSIKSLSFFASTREELDRMDKDDLMIAISIDHNEINSLHTNSPNKKNKSFNIVKDLTTNFNNKDETGKNANCFFKEVLGFNLDEIFNKVRTEKYDIKYIESTYNEEYDISYSTIFCFYYYAFILQYRLERMQVEADVSGENFNQNLIKQKTFLLNLNRFFLTTNRSENKDIKSIANKVKEQFDLEKKIAIRSKNIQLFEDLVVRKISAIDDHRGKVLNRSMTIVTFLGMPLILISTLMALNPTAKVVTETVTTIDSVRWVLIFSIVPLAIIGFLQIWHKLFSKKPDI